MDRTAVLLSLAVATLVLLRLYRRGRSRNVLLYVAAFFVLFAYGPVVNLMTGREAYFGIVQWQVTKACVGFALAMLGTAAADSVRPQRERFDGDRVCSGDRTYHSAALVFACLGCYGAWKIATAYPAMLSGGKLEQLAAAGQGHRIYLLLQLCAVSLFFVSRRSPVLRRLWAANLVVYVTYSLLTSERDFLLVLLSIVVHRELLSNRARTALLTAFAVAGVVAASLLFSVRAERPLDLTVVLNQGSLLFVDTFLMRLVPDLIPYASGRTYRQTAVGILPSWVVDTGTVSLGQWLARLHAPASPSGYGFSLTGEAYLNFGLAGIPAVFFLTTLGHRFVVNRADRSDWWCFASVYSTAVWMYALRGDSAQLAKSLLYGSAFFAVVHVLSRRRSRTDRVRRRPRAGLPAHDRRAGADAGAARPHDHLPGRHRGRTGRPARRRRRDGR